MAADPTKVASVVQLLQASATTDNAVQRQVSITMQQYAQDPLFARYLCVVFEAGDG